MLFYFTIGQQLPCGSTPISQSRVIGGQDAKLGAWPWQVQIIVQLAQSSLNAQVLSSRALTQALSQPYLKAIRLFRLSIAPLFFRQRCRRTIL